MEYLNQEGKTIEDAIIKALEKLNISREEANIEVIDEGSKGIFGLIGSKNAVVKVNKKIDPVKIGQEFLESIFKVMPFEAEISVIDEETGQEQIMYNISSRNLGLIIGHRGETLDSFQYLTSLIVNKKTDTYYRVLIDAEGYRNRREKTLERLAKRLANKVMMTRRKVMLEPMPPHERRIIHMTLRGDSRVKTYSEGKEPYRKVMIEGNDH